MENDTNYDASSDVANENEKGGEDVKASDEKEEKVRNTMDTEQVKAATDGEEEDSVKEEIKVTDGSEVEERNEEKGKAVHPIPNEELLTKYIPSESTTHPNPPPRQNKKNRPNNETGEDKDTHEEAHDGRNVSDCKENNEDKGITVEPEKKTRRRKSNTALQNEMEGTKSKSENSKDDDNTGNSIRNRDKNINPKGEDEVKQTVDNNIRETDLEKDKEDTKVTRNSIRNRDKQLNPTSEDEGKPTIENNKEKDLEKEDSKDNISFVGLKKELGLVNCVGIIVGNIIGTGIFVSPRAVLQYSGSVGMSLLVWVISGVMCIIGAFCYAELGTMIPQSGGNYAYLYEAYGSFAAFIYLWMKMTIGIPGSRAVAALSFANYVLQPFFPDGQPPPDSALRLVGIALMVILAYVNCKRVRWATRVQELLALTKVFALIVIIVVGMFHLFRGTTQNYEDPMEGTTTNPALLATAFYHTFYAYDGWESLNDIMEELKDPFRNFPRAIAISVTCVIVIYTLTNVAYFAVLPKDLMLASPAVAVTFGNLTLGVIAWTIPVFVACSISGGLNGGTITNSRLLFVSARRGHLPRLLSFVHIENNTPVTSLIFLTFMSMLMFVTSDVRVLINYIAFAGNLMALVCISSFFWFRVKHPDWPRPIKVWIGFPIIYIVLSFFLCVMPVVKQPLEVVAALVILATGIPVYYFLVHREQKPQCLLNAMDKITYVSQLLFMAVPEERTS